jgi:hypothetical protein
MVACHRFFDMYKEVNVWSHEEKTEGNFEKSPQSIPM